MWADLACLLPALNETFTAVADDLAHEVEVSPHDALGSVQRTLEKWRRFWGLERTVLTEEAELGLFGEMWFIDQWAPAESAVAAWTGPDGNLHDFVWPSVSVEVKTTRSSDGSGKHRIANLDQLADPRSGRLLLFSLQVSEDAAASNSLNSVIDRLHAKLVNRPDLLMHLDDGLAKVGWSPVIRDQLTRTFRVTAQGLYRVSDIFPRLTRQSFTGDVPAGVVSVSYSIDVAACNPWLLASTAAEGTKILAGEL